MEKFARPLILYPAPSVEGATPSDEDSLRALLARSPDDAGALFALGNLCFRRGDFDAALLSYQKAVELSPVPRLKANLAFTELALGNLSGAAEILEQVLQEESSLDFARLTLARVYLELGRDVSGERSLKELLLRNTHLPEAYEELATIAERRGEKESADEYWVKVFEANRDHFRARDRLCLQLLRQAETSLQAGSRTQFFEQLSRAQRLYAASLSRHQESAALLRTLLQDASRRYSVEEALDLFRAEYRREPSPVLFEELLDIKLLHLGLYPDQFEEPSEAAAERWQQSLREHGEHPFPHYRLGLLAARQGRLQAAITELEICLKVFPAKKHRILKIEPLLSFLRDLVHICDELDQLRGTSASIEEWIKAGFQERFERELWRDAGFAPDDAGSWRDAGFLPVEARSWRQQRLNPHDAALWRSATFEDARTASRLHRAGMTPEIAAAWIQHFPGELSDVVSWYRSGFSRPEEAAAWARAFRVPLEAWAWREQGFSAEEACALREAGIGDPYQARREADARTTPAQEAGSALPDD